MCRIAKKIQNKNNEMIVRLFSIKKLWDHLDKDIRKKCSKSKKKKKSLEYSKNEME